MNSVSLTSVMIIASTAPSRSDQTRVQRSCSRNGGGRVAGAAAPRRRGGLAARRQPAAGCGSTTGSGAATATTGAATAATAPRRRWRAWRERRPARRRPPATGDGAAASRRRRLGAGAARRRAGSAQAASPSQRRDRLAPPREQVVAPVGERAQAGQPQRQRPEPPDRERAQDLGDGVGARVRLAAHLVDDHDRAREQLGRHAASGRRGSAPRQIGAGPERDAPEPIQARPHARDLEADAAAGVEVRGQPPLAPLRRGAPSASQSAPVSRNGV